jgi:hypothetical protein
MQGPWEPRRGSRAHRAGAAVVWLAAALALVGCVKDPPPEEEEDAGTPPPDVCNSREEALTLPECQLILGQVRADYLSFAGDQDWFSFQVPADANARTLLHLTGGYAVPNTAVNLALNLLREDGQTSLARKSDRHGQAAPRPVDIILPFAEPNARLVVLVSDDPVVTSRPNFDLRAPYQLMVEVVEDPDANEPNDTTPTPILLTDQGGVLRGAQGGYLATNGDVDQFSIEVPTGKKVLYLAITGPELTPPPNYRLSYELLDPAGSRVSEGVTPNEFLPLNLATARLSKTGGTYTLIIRGYVPAGSPTLAAGDLRLNYAIDVRVMDEVDPSEGSSQNDTLATARVVNLGSPGSQQTLTGRMGYVPDPDWYAIDLPAQAVPTVLYYRLTPGSGTGRFPPLPGVLDRELWVVKEVTGGTAQDNVTRCRTDKTVCPTSFGNDAFMQGLHTEQCQNFDPPRCLWGLREEHLRFQNLRNFEGALPVYPGQATRYYLVFQDEATDYADDLPYTLTVEWRADPDEASRFSSGQERTTVRPIAEDSALASYPVPPAGSAYEFSGAISYGYGYYYRHNPNNGDGVRSPTDYDAIVSDTDRYELTFPSFDPDAGYLDRGWELQWQLDHVNGAAPHDLAIDLEFCTSPTNCTVRRTIAYTGSNRASWHNVGEPPPEPLQPVYDRQVTASSTTVTARAYGCFCFEPRFVAAGKFYMRVVGTDRESYAPTQYRVRTAYTAYPQGYVGADGGFQSCPPPVQNDAGTWLPGCNFTR